MLWNLFCSIYNCNKVLSILLYTYTVVVSIMCKENINVSINDTPENIPHVFHCFIRIRIAYYTVQKNVQNINKHEKH